MKIKEEIIGVNDSQITESLAVHIVGQVLDEAYVIANAILESGQPWLCRMMFQNYDNTSLLNINVEGKEISSQDYNNTNETIQDNIASAVATSTPHKLQCDTMSLGKNNYIGQGDEDLDAYESNHTLSSSTFINNLFDMSDVEGRIAYDKYEIMQENSMVTESNESLTQAMFTILNSYLNTALCMIFDAEMEACTSTSTHRFSNSSEISEFSFLYDAFETGIEKMFTSSNTNGQILKDLTVQPSEEIQKITDKIEQTKKEDIDLYENIYLTLNRDDEQFSEEDGEPLLQNSKSLSLQEIELITTNTSDENLSVSKLGKEHKLATTSKTSAIENDFRKSTLARRCRIQGAKLLSCFKGWWRRKSPVKNKEIRCLGSNKEMRVPPSGRRRTSSLLNNSSSRPLVWKYNTVTEALVNSTRWKDYTFEPKPQECDDSAVLSLAI